MATVHPIQETISTLDVRRLDRTRMADWNAFVESCPEATFFHRAEWKNVLEQAFGHSAKYLFAERGGRIEGVLPLSHVKSLLFGDSLCSTPFCVYGGIAADTDAARDALTAAAERMAEELDVGYLELRNETAQQPWPVKDLYVRFRKDIDPDPDANMKAIPRKQRAMVRKGMKAGLTSEVDDGIDRLFGAYAVSVRNLGTPVFPKRYFQILKDAFSDDCEILLVNKAGQTVAAVMSFFFRDQVLPYYGGGTDAARELKANDFMYWEVMRRACERGYRVFDYGRSKEGTGSYSFKKNWGFEPEPLRYQYYLVKAKTVPDVNPLNPKYRMFIEMWKRLPLSVANTVGPWLSRSLG